MAHSGWSMSAGFEEQMKEKTPPRRGKDYLGPG
jgi:hypothetical protein